MKKKPNLFPILGGVLMTCAAALLLTQGIRAMRSQGKNQPVSITEPSLQLDLPVPSTDLHTAAALGTTAALDGGICGDDMTWSYYAGSNVLLFSGKGAMYNYENEVQMPWAQYVDDLAGEPAYVVLEEGITSIGDWALFGTNLKGLSLPSSLSAIGDMGLYNADLHGQVLELPQRLSSLGRSALANCKAGGYAIGENNIFFTTQDGMLFDRDMTTLLSFPSGLTGSFVLPDTVKTVADHAFWGCHPDRVDFPAGLETLEPGALEGLMCRSLVFSGDPVEYDWADLLRQAPDTLICYYEDRSGWERLDLAPENRRVLLGSSSLSALEQFLTQPNGEDQELVNGFFPPGSFLTIPERSTLRKC